MRIIYINSQSKSIWHPIPPTPTVIPAQAGIQSERQTTPTIPSPSTEQICPLPLSLNGRGLPFIPSPLKGEG